LGQGSAEKARRESTFL
jgi:hypothetical protein